MAVPVKDRTELVEKTLPRCEALFARAQSVLILRVVGTQRRIRRMHRLAHRLWRLHLTVRRLRLREHIVARVHEQVRLV